MFLLAILVCVQFVFVQPRLRLSSGFTMVKRSLQYAPGDSGGLPNGTPCRSYCASERFSIGVSGVFLLGLCVAP